jgi:hypothetical protein
MFYTRLFLAVLSIAHGIGGVLFDYHVGLSGIVHAQSGGWLFSAGLVGFGALLLVSLYGEYKGNADRFCRDMSLSILAVTWFAIFVHSFEGGADTLTLVSPLYALFAGWSWIREANISRKIKLSTKSIAQN